jgi:hypothetical protein
MLRLTSLGFVGSCQGRGSVNVMAVKVWPMCLQSRLQYVFLLELAKKARLQGWQGRNHHCLSLNMCAH